MKKIELTQDKVALVDDEDYEPLSAFKWHASGRYAKNTKRTPTANIITSMHTLVMVVPNGMCVDHRDGDGFNNQKNNLRICTQAQNLMNRGKQSNNKSGFKGVCWNKKQRKWQANIGVVGHSKYLGLFFCIVKAAKVYDEAAEKYFGEYAVYNFPERMELTLTEV